MTDPSKDYYQERLVQAAAWGQLTAAAAAAGYAPHHSLEGSNHGQVGGYATHPSYLHQLQQNFSHLTQPPSQQQQSQPSIPGYESAQNQGKNVHRVPNGSQTAAYNYSAEQFHRPLPAHSSMPNPSRGGGGAPALPVAAPLPAHMRSHPYQSANYSHLPAYSHYPNYPYPSVHTTSATTPLDKHQLSSSAAHSLALNGNSGSGASYYQPPADPKDFSRSRVPSKESDTSKNQQLQMAKISTSQQQQSSYGYPYESVPTPYNYHQNLYSGPQPQYSLPYPSMPRPPTSLASSTDLQSGKSSSNPKEIQDRPSSKTPAATYQPPQPQRPTYETEKPSSYSMDPATSRPSSDHYNNSNLYQKNEARSGNGYPPATSEAPTLSTTVQHNSSMYSGGISLPPHTNASPSYMPDAHLQATYSSQYINSMTHAAPYQAPPQHPQQQQQQVYHPPAQPEMPPVSTSSVQQSSLSENIPGKEATAGKKNESWKRKSGSKGASEPKQKYFKKDDGLNNKNRSLPPKTDDPYAFNDDEDEMRGRGSTCGPTSTAKELSNNFEYSARFGKDKSIAIAAGLSAAGPVYKFKNALLTRNTESVQQTPSSSPVTMKNIPLCFNPSPELFTETCSKFIEELQTKQYQVSRRASVESWRNTMATKAAEKEKKKKLAAANKKDSNDSRSFDEFSNDVRPSDDSFKYQHPAAPSNERVASDVAQQHQQWQQQQYQQYQPLPSHHLQHSYQYQQQHQQHQQLQQQNPPVQHNMMSQQQYQPNPFPVKDDKNNIAGNPVMETKSLLVPAVALPPPVADKDVVAVNNPKKEEVKSSPKVESVVLKEEKMDKDISIIPGERVNQTSDTPSPVQPKMESDSKTPGAVSTGNPGGNKKGGLWALPIVPKLPQKPPDKRPNSLGLAGLPAVSVKKTEPVDQSPTAPSGSAPGASVGAAQGSGVAPLADVWRQAFGAAKPKKPAETVSTGNVRTPKQEPSMNSDVGGVKKDEKTYLDIPPEVRRRPKPTFGGLIHFSPDWERSVRNHHERCRLPGPLKNIQVHPKILSSSQQPLVLTTPAVTPLTQPPNSSESKNASTPTSQQATSGCKYAASISAYLGSPSDSSDTEHMSPPQTAAPSSSFADTLMNSSKNVVETILENRKKLRMSVAIGRMFRLPVTPEKKRYNSKGTMGGAVRQSKRPDIHGLMPTPGMPIWMEAAEQSSPEGSLSPTTNPPPNPFGNFRRQTLLRYLGSLNCSPEIKARMLDWKPEVYETKTRRQSHQVKAVTSFREIFGSDPPPVKREKKGKRKRQSSSSNSSPVKKSDLDDSASSNKTSPSKEEKESTQIKRIKITKDVSPTKVKSEIANPVKESPSEIPIKKEAKRSPSKNALSSSSSTVKTSPSKKESGALRETTNVALRRDRSHSETLEKSAIKKVVSHEPSSYHGSKLKEALSREIKKEIPEPPAIKVEVEAEPKKERKKRKPKVAVDESPSTSKAEEIINPEDYQFCCGGSASGAMAAATLAAEAAAAKALEKEKPLYKRTPKKLKLKQEAAAATNEDSESDSYNPTESEENLQKELQNYALDLLEENPSWEKRKIIQNLVIWEFVPVDPSLLPPPLLVNPPLPAPVMKPPAKRKGKKMRKHQSGLDFAKKKTPGKNSRCVSRATTPEIVHPEEVHDITYTLDDLIAETTRWVIDKSAGETILHRASKMGYPDAAAYALDMAKMSPVMKDNAGIPPIHKAAFRGHSEIVDYLLRYGSDPNTNVKGTRPLHEALESGTLASVYHLLCHGADPLLYDYSGNMPIDLAEENEEMFFYFSNILTDLHGRKGKRWNVSHKLDFIMPQNDDEESISSSSSAHPTTDFEFEVTNRIQPPVYRFSDREGRFLLALDFKSATSIDLLSPKHLSNSKHEVIEMSKDDFIRLGHCCDLGVKPNSEIYSRDKIVLVKIDSNIKKLLEKADSHYRS